MGFEFNKKGEKYGRRKDVLASVIFLMISYICLKNLPDNALSWILGIVLMIAGIYGIVCVGNKLKFIF